MPQHPDHTVVNILSIMTPLIEIHVVLAEHETLLMKIPCRKITESQDPIAADTTKKGPKEL